MGCCQGNTDDDIDITQGGLTKKRGCTDILCTILFFIFTFYWLSLAALAFENGDPERMLYVSFLRHYVNCLKIIF